MKPGKQYCSTNTENDFGEILLKFNSIYKPKRDANTLLYDRYSGIIDEGIEAELEGAWEEELSYIIHDISWEIKEGIKETI